MEITALDHRVGDTMKRNLYIVEETKTNKTVLVTLSARKAKKLLGKGRRIDVWCDGERCKRVHLKTASDFDVYISLEKDYIREKQARAEERNRMKREG